ncbi:MAG: hypothetical protein ACREJR_03660, partial [Candidatus Rokuibacteriota bacterium]
MEQYTDQALRTLGLPSRSQVVSVASQLVALEERVEGLEERLDEIRRLLVEAGGPAKRTETPPPGAADAGGRRADRPPTRPPRRPREA